LTFNNNYSIIKEWRKGTPQFRKTEGKHIMSYYLNTHFIKGTNKAIALIRPNNNDTEVKAINLIYGANITIQNYFSVETYEVDENGTIMDYLGKQKLTAELRKTLPPSFKAMLTRYEKERGIKLT
jgi:hypothetical protein